MFWPERNVVVVGAQTLARALSENHWRHDLSVWLSVRRIFRVCWYIQISTRPPIYVGILYTLSLPPISLITLYYMIGDNCVGAFFCFYGFVTLLRAQTFFKREMPSKKVTDFRPLLCPYPRSVYAIASVTLFIITASVRGHRRTTVCKGHVVLMFFFFFTLHCLQHTSGSLCLHVYFILFWEG